MSSSAAPFAREFHARLLAREDAAWRVAFTRLWPVAFAAARQAVRSPADAEDAAALALGELAQTTALPVEWRAMEALTAVIARRRAISLLREATAQKRGGGAVLSLDHALDAPAAATSARQAVDLLAALDQLDPLRRRLVEEHFLEGLTSGELARRHQLNPATIRSHLHRAVQILRRWLQSDAAETKPPSSATNP